MRPAEELEVRTNLYWDLSHHLHGPKSLKKAPSTALALAACREIIRHLGPHHPLLRKILQVQETIIMGGTKKKKTSPRNNVLRLRKVE